ncbi:MAG: hypothetical protein KatS3mg023_3598 [Armatimonadota bacterium]|nr:MAG: hypothetical protein KatS3mg023_3598 [Armatimonadota bacterium]
MLKPGKRYLFRDRYGLLVEFIVLELTPNGNVKVRRGEDGGVFWLSAEQMARYELVEELPSKMATAPPVIVREDSL